MVEMSIPWSGDHVLGGVTTDKGEMGKTHPSELKDGTLSGSVAGGTVGAAGVMLGGVEAGAGAAGFAAAATAARSAPAVSLATMPVTGRRSARWTRST